jgi:kumamolisin
MGINDGLPITPHSGDWLAWLGGANYETSRLYQDISIPAGTSYLTFWMWAGSAETGCVFDYASVFFDDVELWSMALCDNYDTHGWVKIELGTSSFAGQTGSLLFLLTTDSSLPSSFFVDDVSLIGETIPVELVNKPAREELREPVLKKGPYNR